jgi:2-oxoglutarate dehydrogenase E1 component
MHRARLLGPFTSPTRCLRVAQSTAAAAKAEPFMTATSGVYIEQMYENWRRDPASVHGSWDAYFRNVDAGLPPGQAFQSPPAVAGARTTTPSVTSSAIVATQAPNLAQVKDHLKVQLLIRSFQVIPCPL